jgi:DNA mismatch repair protein MutS
VAQLAGVPRSVNDRAREVLAWLEAQHESADNAACGLAESSTASYPSLNGHAARTNAPWQMTLFGVEEHPLLDEIRGADLDEMRPLAALELLHSWQQRLSDEQVRTKAPR